MNTGHKFQVDGMDPLLGMLLATAAFAFFIFLVQRSVKFIALLGVAVTVVFALAVLGVVEL